jgi:hypothetical protein
MKSNQELQKNVVDAINWEPLLQAAESGVMVQQGVVTLTRSVNIDAKNPKQSTPQKI